MAEERLTDQLHGEASVSSRRHPITLENSPEETIRRMRAFPERAAKLRETLRALREANSRIKIKES